jgi:hypothetical protein
VLELVDVERVLGLAELVAGRTVVAGSGEVVHFYVVPHVGCVHRLVAAGLAFP